MTDGPSPQLDRLIAGYRRFRETGWYPRRERWSALREAQQPEIMVIFDVDPGEIFVVRNVAAMVPPFETTPGHHGVSAALEFAVQVLRVREIVVMGHGMCGGCQAALTQELRGAEPGEGGFIADWIALLDEARTPVAARYGTTGRVAERAMEQAAVKASIGNLRTFPCIQRKEETGHLRLTGAFFAISDGLLHVLDETDGEFHPVS